MSLFTLHKVYIFITLVCTLHTLTFMVVILTFGSGPSWLKNLYFAYLLVLRAVEKAEGYWQHQQFYTGSLEEAVKTKRAVLDVVDAAKLVPTYPMWTVVPVSVLETELNQSCAHAEQT